MYLAVFAILLTLFIVYSRIRYRAPYLYSWDSVSFALSIEKFDMRLHQPHPPGYILYSKTIDFIDGWVKDANLTMIYLNIAATIGACWFIAKLVYDLTQNSNASAGAAALYAANPVSWFYGSVAEVYAVEGFWVSVIAYLVLATRRRGTYLLWASAAMAAAGGYRPTTEVFLLPFYAAAYFYASFPRKRFVYLTAAFLIFVMGNFIWFWPLAQSVGGVSQYVTALQEQSQRAADATAELPAERLSWNKLGVRIVQTITLPVLLLLIVRMRRIRITRNDAALLLIIIPPLLVFGALHFPKDGYLLLVIPPLLSLFIVLLGRVCPNKSLISATLAVAFVISVVGYLRPFPAKAFVYEFTRPNYEILHGRMERLKRFFEVTEGLGGGRSKTFVLENRHFFPNWRMLLYYYPGDTVYLVWPNKKRAYVARNHRYRTIVPPLHVDPDSMLIAVGRSAPSFPAETFQVDSFRYHFAEAWNLPRAFQVYSMKFVSANDE